MNYIITQKTIDRFWSKVEFTTDCWLWNGIKNNNGYAGFGYGKRTWIGAHRFVYELYNGEIPEKMVVDHLCRVRHCVNPHHMEVVTQRENLLRGKTIPAIHSQKTHCVRGHELKGDNLYSPKDGSRQCQICRTMRNGLEKTKIMKRDYNLRNKEKISLQKKEYYQKKKNASL